MGGQTDLACTSFMPMSEIKMREYITERAVKMGGRKLWKEVWETDVH